MNDMHIRPCGPGYMYCDGRCSECEYMRYYTTYTTKTEKSYENETAYSVTPVSVTSTVQ